MATERDEERAREQAKAQLESIKEMVAALQCDYDRLEELKDERQTFVDDIENADGERERIEAQEALAEWDNESGDELKELTEAAGECSSQDEARERILEDALEVSVRSDWYSPGDKEGQKPSEYLVLLCTGGPAARIVGELNQYGEPTSARLEYQDWFTPWREYITTGADHEALLTYAQCFYFGE